MLDRPGGRLVLRLSGVVRAALILAAAGLAGGCSGMSSLGLGDASEPAVAQAAPGADQGGLGELEKATEYWGKQYAANPRDPDSALNYAKNLKAMGRKKEALVVLQQAHLYHAQNREHLSEYGRLALELGQDSLAARLLERADDPIHPDWRVLSARGTVLAKQGRHKEAIAFFERARALAPNQASVLNNLALALAMDGQAQKAEGLLREAEQAGDDPRVRQNLALVLGLQSKYAEAKGEAAKDLPEEDAQANVDFLRRIVRTEPKAGGTSEPTAPSDWTAVATSSTSPAGGVEKESRTR
jgi:Flp pilus assembly protein TadD